MAERTAGAGNGLIGIIALGIILVLMGVPFVGMAVMASMMVGRKLGQGLPLALGILVVVYLISDFSGALIAAAGSGVLAGSVLTGRGFRMSAAAAASAAAVGSILGTVILPGHSLLSPENVQALVQLYSTAGMSSSEILFMMELLDYILPALLAVWAVAGTLASVAAARLICRRGGTWPDIAEGDPIRLGLLPAWILIAALAVNLAGTVPPVIRQAAVNVSIFMIVPYTAVGLSICRKLLLLYPQVFLVLLLGIIFPPLAIGALAVAGILDTWLDLRTRIERSKERKNQ
ncbi:MAG: hypothetical protein JXA64_10625 [Candidatus Fermentibacteraceae bacterium]|nr:hypothetical protein [Candidatus Fermentibacteraceae bacterium]MBN2609557.1 hypothetical protein [Candidatus Fermentibacteraceae bacterium]